MSEDPVEAIKQVLDSIDEATQFGGGGVVAGWLHNAPKQEILEWIAGSLRGRVINALRRTEETMSVLSGAWTEDDEKMLNTALWHLSNSISNGESQDIRCETTEWLKRLRERVRSRTGRLRNCDRFDTGDVEKDANDALRAYLASGVCGYRAVAGWMLSPIDGKGRSAVKEAGNV